MADLFVTQDEYDDLIEKLILKVADDGYEFDTILCLARGGMRVGDIFSRVHNMPLAVLATSSYREEAGKVQGNCSCFNDDGARAAERILQRCIRCPAGKSEKA